MNVTSNQNWLRFLNEGGYFDYRLQPSVESDFLCQVLCPHTYTQIYTHTSIIILLINTWTWHVRINRAVILFLQLRFNMCISKKKKEKRKKLDVIWIYSTLLIYSFTLWSHCGDLPQWNFFFWHINYCNVTINILFSFTWQIWYERKLYSIFTHIYARDVIKERTTHIAMHSASNIHRYICL